MPPKKRKMSKAQNDESATTSKYFKTDTKDNILSKEIEETTKPSSQKSKDVLSPGTNSRLSHSFYNQECTELAKKLLGTKVYRKKGEEILSGIIVETEAYLGGEDKAAHSYNGKRTPKNEAMYMPPGTAYVYHIYGAYTCLNISAKGEVFM